MINTTMLGARLTYWRPLDRWTTPSQDQLISQRSPLAPALGIGWSVVIFGTLAAAERARRRQGDGR